MADADAAAHALDGARVLVVGASSGIGRAIGVAAVAAGARVALVGRRADDLKEAAEEAGPGAVAIPADVRDPAACEELVARAVAPSALGGLDALVYAAATLPLGRVADTPAETWRAVLETNVVGAALVTRAALPHLRPGAGRAVYLSSDSTVQPRPAVVPYTVSKAALEALVGGLRLEVPEVSFTRLVLGPTVTDIARDWEPGAIGEVMREWAARGITHDAVMTVEEVATEVVHLLASPVRLDDVLLEPRPGR